MALGNASQYGTVNVTGAFAPAQVYTITTATLNALGLASTDVAWDKLQLGLAEIFIEAQSSASGLAGAARTAAMAGFDSINTMALVAGGYVAIDAVAADGNGAALMAKLQALGLQSGAYYGAMTGGLMPIDALDELAGLAELAFARPSYASTNVGLVTSQDVAALRADDASATYGVNGAGITIGVLSDSFNTRVGPITNYAQDVTNGDLPAGVIVLKDSPTAGSDEGRGMAQLIYDIAPGASLAFYTAFVSQADFANGIVQLAAISEIVVDDVFYYAEPFFQDGIVAQAVNQAVDMGAMYFSSAGNSAARAYQSEFRGTGTGVNIAGGQGAGLFEYHDFDPGAGVDDRQSITLGAGAVIVLQWDQPYRSVSTTGVGSASEMAVIIWNGAGQAVGVTNTLNFNGDPLEIVSGLPAGTYSISLLLKDGSPPPGTMKYVVYGGYTANEFGTNSPTSSGHSNADGAIAVGAAPWFGTPEYGLTQFAVESFSSKGGTPILFDVAGNRLDTPIVRDKVEFTASDGGNTSFFGQANIAVGIDTDQFPNFFGTSAAAPNAAAVAALLMQKFPTATPSQIEAAMKASAIDIVNGYAGSGAAVGVDSVSGAGLIQTPGAIVALQAILDAANPGANEIAIIGFNTGQSDASGNPATADKLHFVALSPLTAGTVIYFTDRAWNGTSFTTAAGDGTLAYTVAANTPAGTVITLSQAQLAAAGVDLQEAGDAVYAYLGTDANVPTKFLFALELGDGNATFDGSLANTGLSVGNGAVSVATDSGAYSGPTTVSGALLASGGAQTLLQSVSNANLWTGDDRDTANALEAPAQTGPWLVAADLDIIGVAAGGGGGIVKTSADESLDLGDVAFNPNIYFNGVTSGGQPILFAAKDIVLDTVEGRFFVTDSDGAGGHNRVLQGNIADLRNLSTPPTLTVLYSDSGITPASRIGGIAIDPNENWLYVTHGSQLIKLGFYTPNQAGIVLFDANAAGNPTGATGNQLNDIVANFGTGEIYLSSGRVVAGAAGDDVTDNYVYKLSGLTPLSGAGAFTFAAGNTGSASLLPFAPNGGQSTFALPETYGAIESLGMDPATQTLLISTREVSLDTDANPGTPAVYAGGSVIKYALTGNAPGNYVILYQQTAPTSGVVPGAFGDIEYDGTTGKYYVLDTIGADGVPNDQNIFTGPTSVAVDPVQFSSAIGNVAGLTVTGITLNYAPKANVSANTVSVTELAGAGSTETAGAALYASATLADFDTRDGSVEIAGAIVRIAGNYQTGAAHQDYLRINGEVSGVTDLGIFYTFNPANGAMVLSGAGTTAAYQAALALVTFSTSGDDPTAGGTAGTRTITLAVSDGLSLSDDVTTTLTVVGTNDAPVNVVPAGPVAVVEDAAIGIAGLSVSDVDAGPAGRLSVTLAVGAGTITVDTNILGGVTPFDVTGNGTGSVTVTGTAAELNATFAAALGVKYLFTANGGGSTTFTMTTSDLGLNGAGGARTDVDSFTINAADSNEAPVLGGIGISGSVLEQVPTLIAGSATVSDSDSPNFDGGSLTVAITFNKVVAQDQLFIGNVGGVTVAMNVVSFGGTAIGTVAGGGPGGGDVVVTFNASATTAAVQAVVRAVAYANSSDVPTTTARSITYTLVDGDGGTNDRATIVQSIATIAVNDAPAGTDITRTVNEDVSYTLTPADFGYSDAENNVFSAVVFTTLPATGRLLVDTDGSAATPSIPVTLGQEVTIGAITVGRVTFEPAANASGAPYASFTFQVRDNGPTTNGGQSLDQSPNTFTFNVTPVDDAPVAVADSGATTDAATTIIAVLGNDIDVDAGSKTVATINGVAVTAGGAAVTLASGATAALNVDGTVTYNPNGRFDALVSPATAAATGAQGGPGFTTASDSFTYTLNGGAQATVTVAITGTDGPNDRLRGSTSADTITGTPGADYIDVSQGGADTASGGDGNDVLYFGAEFGAGDLAQGGAGTNDQFGLQGDYSAGLTLSGTQIQGVEVIVALPGFSYSLTTADDLIAPGQQMKFYAANLAPGQDFTLNGAAETNGDFFVIAGNGTDTITGGGGNDAVYFGPGRYDRATDTVNGGAGTNDQVGFDGVYALTLDGVNITNVEVIALLPGSPTAISSYTATVTDGFVAAGGMRVITGTSVTTAMTIDGSLEADGNLRIFGGRAGDTITGGGGADLVFGNLGADTLAGGLGGDSFLYDFAVQSTSLGYDRIVDFSFGTDVLDLSGTHDVFARAGGTLSAATFDADLLAAFPAGALDAGGAVVFTATAGDLSGQTFVIVDYNGVDGYQAGQDLVVRITADPGGVLPDFIV